MKHTQTHTDTRDAYCVLYGNGDDLKQSPAFQTVEDALYHLYAHIDNWTSAVVKRLRGQGHTAIQGEYYPRHYGYMDMKKLARKIYIA